MTMFGNGLIVGGSALLAAGAVNALNAPQLPPGIATGVGVMAIGIGTAFELLG